jgi:hypothetical protein
MFLAGSLPPIGDKIVFHICSFDVISRCSCDPAPTLAACDAPAKKCVSTYNMAAGWGFIALGEVAQETSSSPTCFVVCGRKVNKIHASNEIPGVTFQKHTIGTTNISHCMRWHEEAEMLKICDTYQTDCTRSQLLQSCAMSIMNVDSVRCLSPYLLIV